MDERYIRAYENSSILESSQLQSLTFEHGSSIICRVARRPILNFRSFIDTSTTSQSFSEDLLIASKLLDLGRHGLHVRVGNRRQLLHPKPNGVHPSRAGGHSFSPSVPQTLTSSRQPSAHFKPEIMAPFQAQAKLLFDKFLIWAATKPKIATVRTFATMWSKLLWDTCIEPGQEARAK